MKKLLVLCYTDESNNLKLIRAYEDEARAREDLALVKTEQSDDWRLECVELFTARSTVLIRGGEPHTQFMK